MSSQRTASSAVRTNVVGSSEPVDSSYTGAEAGPEEPSNTARPPGDTEQSASHAAHDSKTNLSPNPNRRHQNNDQQATNITETQYWSNLNKNLVKLDSEREQHSLHTNATQSSSLTTISKLNVKPVPTSSTRVGRHQAGTAPPADAA